MATDRDLKDKVVAELEWEPAVDANSIAVAVDDGVVTLAGEVETLAHKGAVAAAVRRVAGVRAVALELDVKLAIPHRRSDAEIATHAGAALQSNTLIPADAIRLTVDDGRITLQGEVPWEFQRRAAQRAVSQLIGVVEIRNEIRLRTNPQPADLAQRIEDALSRQAWREARHIDVVVDGTTVKLTGLVNSWHDRETAEAAAWRAPGVERVVNELLSV
jgi:osmotically-inducible protein OsmY